jgi:hypothetical protein
MVLARLNSYVQILPLHRGRALLGSSCRLLCPYVVVSPFLCLLLSYVSDFAKYCKKRTSVKPLGAEYTLGTLNYRVEEEYDAGSIHECMRMYSIYRNGLYIF